MVLDASCQVCCGPCQFRDVHIYLPAGGRYLRQLPYHGDNHHPPDTSDVVSLFEVSRKKERCNEHRTTKTFDGGSRLESNP